MHYCILFNGNTFLFSELSIVYVYDKCKKTFRFITVCKGLGEVYFCSTVTSESSSSVEKDDEVDSWSEIQDTEIERAGIFDTMFTSANFVEDSERAAVYGSEESSFKQSLKTLLFSQY